MVSPFSCELLLLLLVLVLAAGRVQCMPLTLCVTTKPPVCGQSYKTD